MQYKDSWLKRNIVGFGLTSFFNDFSHEMTTAILPAFIEQLVGPTLAPSMLGLVSGISDAASSFVKIWSGIITDRIQHYKMFLIIGYALTPMFVGLIGTAHAIWQIVLYKTVAWTGRGMREPMRDTWISQIIKPEHYGQAFGFVRALDTLGAIAGPLVAFFAIKSYSLETIFYISLIPGALSVLALIFLTQEDKIKAKKTDYHNWREHLKKLPASFNYFVLVMFVFGIGNFNKMFIIYRAQELLSGQSISMVVATGWAILLYILFNVIRAISEYSFGTLSDYVSRSFLLSLGGYGLFGVSSLLLIINHSSLFLWIAIFLCAGMSTGIVTSLEKSYAARLLPEEVRGTGFGVLQTIDGIGDLLSSIFVGFLWSFISPESGFVYAAVLSFLAALLLMIHKNIYTHAERF